MVGARRGHVLLNNGVLRPPEVLRVISLVLRSPFAEGSQGVSRRGGEVVPSRGSGHSVWEVDTFSPPLPPAFPPLPAPFQQNVLASFPSPPYPPAPLPPRRYQAWLSSAASTLAKAPGWVQDCTSGLDWHRIPGPSPSWQAGRDGSRPRVSWSISDLNEEKVVVTRFFLLVQPEFAKDDSYSTESRRTSGYGGG